jgi:hypothetical protein
MTGTPATPEALAAMRAVLEAHTILASPASDRDCRCSCGWAEPIADPALPVKYRRHMALYLADAVWPLAVAATRRQVADEIRAQADRKRVPKADPDANAYRRVEANILDLMAARIAEGTKEGT